MPLIAGEIFALVQQGFQREDVLWSKFLNRAWLDEP
ncbi:hypothetical protein LI6934_10195 [Bacillus licheniformis LMG 6934]|nr:hypothetical protein LI6934_10195 [Bacillus licheniformis LMG 6934]